MKRRDLLFAGVDEGLAQSLQGPLWRHGCEIIEVSDRTSVIRIFRERDPDLVIIGPSGPDRWDEIGLAQDIRRLNSWVPIVLIPSSSSEELAIAALRAGVTDYFRQPIVLEELVARVVRCLAGAIPSPFLAPSEAAALQSEDPPHLIGESASMREINAYIGQVASTDSTVLITGETGTGKELVAALIHMRSPRAGKPFVSINCAAIPESLLESELFGYERGAFTGAHVQKEGALKLANEGTAFFDEIGDMSPEGQAKILRAIESKEIRRLGGKRSIPLDLRVIAATNQDLERRVAEGKFRKDLYYRLNVARISLPPLRDRKEDIPALFGHYIGELNRHLGREVEGFGDDALGPLLRYDWPGNVRELKNLLEEVYVHFRSQWIAFTDLPGLFRSQLANAGQPQTERDLLLCALLSTRWNKSQAAQKLHWSRMTLYRKIAKYEIVRENRTDDGTPRISEEAV
jgi:DNA-binding NtrC family response regulator